MKCVPNVVENCYCNTEVLSQIFTQISDLIIWPSFSDISVYFNMPGTNRLYLLSLVFAFEKKD